MSEFRWVQMKYMHKMCAKKHSTNAFLLYLLNCSSKKYQSSTYRRNHRRCSVRKGVLRNFAKFTGKHLYQSLFFNKAATLLKKAFGTGVFQWILRNFSEHVFYKKPLGDCFCTLNLPKILWNKIDFIFSTELQ